MGLINIPQFEALWGFGHFTARTIKNLTYLLRIGLFQKNSFNSRRNSNRIPMLLDHFDTGSNRIFINKWAYTIVNQNDIFIMKDFMSCLNAMKNRFLSTFSTRNDAANFINRIFL